MHLTRQRPNPSGFAMRLCLLLPVIKIIMRTLTFLALVFSLLVMTSCSNNAATGKTFCDTACSSDSLTFKGDNKFNPLVSIGVKACTADTVLWTYDLIGGKMLSLRDDLGQDVYLNKSAIDAYFKDTSYVWLQFNDCKTGRGYLLKLPFGKSEERRKITGAFTKFDPKFSIASNLIVYTDRGSVFVENLENGNKASMPFDKTYDIDFNKLHEMVDSVHVTHDRIFVQMIRDGKPVPYEKKINLSSTEGSR